MRFSLSMHISMPPAVSPSLSSSRGSTGAMLSEDQMVWLRSGLEQPGGKLTRYQKNGILVSQAMVSACLRAGLIEPWVHNPLSPPRVYRLTDAGRVALLQTYSGTIRVDFSQWKRDTALVAGSMSTLDAARAVPPKGFSSSVGLRVAEDLSQQSDLVLAGAAQK